MHAFDPAPGVEQWQARHDVAGAPPRLLIGIDNKRGAKTEIRYAPLSDPAVVDNEPDVATGSLASPRTQWVVMSITSSDAFDASSGTTTYFYDDPVFNPDLEVVGRQLEGRAQ